MTKSPQRARDASKPKSATRQRQNETRTSEPLKAAETYRALTEFTSLPPYHMTFQITEDGSEPHLKRGEYAVIDTSDRSVQNGELFLIQYQSGNRARRIVQVKAGKEYITPTGPKQQVWWCCDLRGFRPIGVPPSGSGGVAQYTGLADGPYLADGLENKLLGRVVGYATRSLSKELARAAGWENEDIGNAQFDAAEYIDTMTRLGHRLVVHRGYYWEYMPERALTERENEEMLAVRWKYVRASTALQRVKAECERWGMVS